MNYLSLRNARLCRGVAEATRQEAAKAGVRFFVTEFIFPDDHECFGRAGTAICPQPPAPPPDTVVYAVLGECLEDLVSLLESGYAQCWEPAGLWGVEH
jgi:hypothetical protein